VVQHAQVTITETQNQVTNEQGDWIDVGKTTVTANAVNVGDGQKDYTGDQLKTMEKIGTAIVDVAVNVKGFDATIMLGIARTETHFGTLPSKETSPAKQTDINPTQLSSTSGLPPTTDLRTNVERSMVQYNRGLADTLNQSLQNYNTQADKANYARTAEGYMNSIRGSVHTTYSPPKRLMEMIRP